MTEGCDDTDDTGASGARPAGPPRSGVGEVRPLRSDDVEAAARLLARAFVQDPIAAAALPDPGDRQRVLARFMAHEVRTALPSATVEGIEVAGELAGVALWYPPEATPRSLPATLRLARELVEEVPTLLPAAPRLLGTLARDLTALSRQVTQRQGAFQRAGQPPATYLALLATDPEHRGRGLARRLLEPTLGTCDADGVAVWLHTTDPVNLGFYARFGFRCLERIPGGRAIADLWVLRREPRT